MRILFVSAPLFGHLNSLVPLIQATRNAGHEVAVATGADAVNGLPTDIEAIDIAPGFDFGRIARKLMLRHPLVARAELNGTGGLRGVSLLFGAANEQMADAAIGAARAWQPDVVVHEPLAVAGAVAAAAVDVPAVIHGNSLFDDAELTRAVSAALPNRKAQDTALTLTIAPPSVVGQREGLLMRPVPYSGQGELPAWLTEDNGRPRIMVSRSTVAGPGGGNHMKAVVDVAAGVDADIVLVRPSDKITNVPGNVRTTNHIPLADAIPYAAAIVHHGGAGTVLDAVAAGVPQLVVPGPGDRRRNAELIAARGAGLAVPTKQITAAHLNALVTDARLGDNAREVAQEIAAMPAPEERVADVIAAGR
jgi:UDP:flavonoid glycosyltransferase YjiC (YdhE family)